MPGTYTALSSRAGYLRNTALDVNRLRHYAIVRAIFQLATATTRLVAQ